MPVITGGKVIEPQTTNPGVRSRIYYTTGVPTDTTIGVTAANGMVAMDVANGNIYERAAGVWTRVDTL
jgi:hypothetical protein